MESININIDIVIPVLDGYECLVNLLKSFGTQRYVNIKNVIVALTINNNFEEINKTREFIIENNIRCFEVSKEKFSHSLVREKAIKEYCSSNIVVLLTQDVKLIDYYSIYNLVKDIDNKQVVYTFGRQVCYKKRCIEKYIRDFNYPNKSYISTKEKIQKYQIKAFFASDVFAALDRNIFIRLNGYGGINVPTNEDMLYMYRLLTNGYKAKFCSDAIVEHYHSYSLKSLYRRYYNSGVFFKKVKIFDQYKKTDSGKKLAFYILKEAFKHFDFITLIRWLPNMFIRYIGMKNGMHN